MIRKSRARSSSLFLMELILAILFFSAASAVCVQFFVKSHLLSREADVLAYAVNECSGAAETLAAAGSPADGIALLQRQYPDGAYPAGAPAAADPADMEIRIYYDDAFTPCPDTDAAYTMIVRIGQAGQVMAGNIRMVKNEDRGNKGNGAPADSNDGADPISDALIYELNTRHPIARRTGYEKR